jgi:hypothetical protein
MASFRPRQLAGKMEYPISAAASKTFARWLGAFVSAAFIIAACTAGAIADATLAPYSRSDPPWFWTFALNPFALGTTAVGLIAWAMTASGLAGSFYRDKALMPQQAQRALALSRYSAAPLTFFALALVLLSGLTLTHWWTRPRAINAVIPLYGIFVALCIAQAIAWLILHRRPTTRRAINLPLVIVTGIAGAMATFIAWARDDPLADAIIAISAERLAQVISIAALLSLIWWWLISVRLLHLTTGCPRGRAVCAAIAMPVMCSVILAVCLASAHALLFIAVMALLWN